jgi:hypothetical protein
MTNEELYWLAGWLEGEGTFYFSATRGNSPKLAIQAFSVDRDVIDKAASIAGGKVYYIKPRLHVQGGWDSQEGWRFSLERLPAVALIHRLMPLMSFRRQAQLQKALNGWENRSNKPTLKMCACGCGRQVTGGPRRKYARSAGINGSGACAQRAFRQRQAAA